MKYKAIIFDMDGTIIDSENVWHLATKKLLQDRNIEPSQEILTDLFNTITGSGLPFSCSLIKKNFGLRESVEEIAQEKSNLATRFYQESARFIDGFTMFHAYALKYQLKTALATNADNNFMHMINTKLNLNKYFNQHLYNISHVNNIGKPNPAIYLHAADKIQVDPRHCIAIEDSAHGIKAAKDAGMFCIGINTSKCLEQVKHADIIINYYYEINLDKLIKI